jgi:UDP-N-acetylmuramoyl-L-alanyl-D-glutamate--2,6-diaminopimelate ligase
VQFFCAQFTNLTQDHLDFHGDMQSYADAKRRLFNEFASELTITNADDEFGAGLIDVANSGFIASYGDSGDVSVVEVHLSERGMRLSIEANELEFEVSTSLIGKVNIPNVLMLVTVLLSLSTELEDIQRVVTKLKPAPGRMELHSSENTPSVVIDYSHTPDALAKALDSVQQHCQGKLWCVFGCGGDRDIQKRPIMGNVVATMADRGIVTNDNPRSENPAVIAEHIMGGVDMNAARAEFVEVELDRAAAINASIQRATANDWVLIAGKGHETTQQIGDELRHFSDREHVVSALRGGM